MIELADVIRDLRSELDRARSASEQEALRFGLGPVELEVTVALDREGKTGGKVRFWVVEVGAEGKVASTSTQRIKLTLHPMLATPDDGGEPGSAEVTAAATPAAPAVSVYVHGAAVPGER